MKSLISNILVIVTLLCQPPLLHAEEIIITAVGDIMLAGKWTTLLRQKGYDYPLNGVREELAGRGSNSTKTASFSTAWVILPLPAKARPLTSAP